MKKTFHEQYLAMIQSDSAGGHWHGQQKSDMFMTDLAGRFADTDHDAMHHAAGGLADSA